MGAGEWIAFASAIVACVIAAIAATWKIATRKGGDSMAEQAAELLRRQFPGAAERSPLAQLQHDVRQTRAVVNGIEDRTRQMMTTLAEWEKHYLAKMIPALEDTARSGHDVALVIESLTSALKSGAIGRGRWRPLDDSEE